VSRSCSAGRQEARHDASPCDGSRAYAAIVHKVKEWARIDNS